MGLTPEEGARDKASFFMYQMFKSLAEIDIGSPVGLSYFVMSQRFQYVVCSC